MGSTSLIGIQDDMLVPFGALHPDLEDKAGEVRRLRQSGIKGIKPFTRH